MKTTKCTLMKWRAKTSWMLTNKNRKSWNIICMRPQAQFRRRMKPLKCCTRWTNKWIIFLLQLLISSRTKNGLENLSSTPMECLKCSKYSNLCQQQSKMRVSSCKRSTTNFRNWRKCIWRRHSRQMSCNKRSWLRCQEGSLWLYPTRCLNCCMKSILRLRQCSARRRNSLNKTVQLKLWYKSNTSPTPSPGPSLRLGRKMMPMQSLLKKQRELDGLPSCLKSYSADWMMHAARWLM